jgi:DNA-binding MarR family transcriptional regulator
MKIEEIVQTSEPIEISKKVMLNMNVIKNISSEKFNEIIRPYGLSIEQFNVLRILRGQNGKVANMGLIQERMMTKNSNTTRLVEKLLLKKMVTRNICEAHKRRMEVLITETGLKVLKELDPKIIAYDSYFTKNLSNEELEALNILLEKFRTEKQ